jgi:tRNA pseudouridine32 synthase/23S rRNA pseudouridine746 synthase
LAHAGGFDKSTGQQKGFVKDKAEQTGYGAVTCGWAVRAVQPSCVALPPVEGPAPTILDFLDKRFWRVGREAWTDRLASGKVTSESGLKVDLKTPYAAGMKLFYYREVEREPHVPFDEEIIYQDENIIVVCKPHFLPVIPTGPYVNECLLYRMIKRTGNRSLALVNRLDRETAGLVLVSANPETRAAYCMLFQQRRIKKHYEAVGLIPQGDDRREWTVESRIVKGKPWFIVVNVQGEPNSKTLIKLRSAGDGLGYFDLYPHTGQQHQLRAHMCLIGSGVVNDSLYPVLQPGPKKDFLNPLQLLARSLAFKDPVSGREMRFESKRQLEKKSGDAPPVARRLDRRSSESETEDFTTPAARETPGRETADMRC